MGTDSILVETVDAGHRGLTNMLDRAHSLGGSLDVSSGSTGTKLLLVIPLDGAGGRRETK